MNLTSIGLDGLKRAEDKLDRTARDLAKLPSLPAPEAASEAGAVEPDQVSLSDSMISLLEARNSYEANLKLISTEDELTQHAIDLLG